MPSPPSQDTLDAFGVPGPAHRLPGGRDTCWAAGDLVLKPGVEEVHQRWLAEELERIDRVGFRLAEPVPTVRGAWLHAGWSASRRLSGRAPDHLSPADHRAVKAASRAFHRSAAGMVKPAFLAHRTDPWAVADRMCWGERPLAVADDLADAVRRIRPALSALGPDQLVHGDLGGNVLLSDGEPPAIIDVSPYWRPVVYAEGIILADVLLQDDASVALSDLTGSDVPGVARGLLFRILTPAATSVYRAERALGRLGL